MLTELEERLKYEFGKRWTPAPENVARSPRRFFASFAWLYLNLMLIHLAQATVHALCAVLPKPLIASVLWIDFRDPR